MSDNLKILQENKRLFFWLELGALLHDIGKLQKAFLDYRRNWQVSDEKDPHDSDFLCTDALLKKASENLQRLFVEQSISSLSGILKDPGSKIGCLATSIFNETIADLVKNHTSPTSDLIHLLKAADSKDAAEDRNNPLFVNEQSKAETIYISSVFGFETPIDAEALDRLRGNLYRELDNLLIIKGKVIPLKSISQELREKVHQAIREPFRQTVSDTNRPANDINLWEHSYATASLFKMYCADLLINNGRSEIEFRDYFNKKFALWGVGWNSLAFYSNAHKIGDISGRKALVSRLKQKIRETVEWQYSLGNAIYDDDNGVFFIIPEVIAGKAAWLEEVETTIYADNSAITEDELSICFASPQNTTLMVPIVNVIDEVKASAKLPWRLSSDRAQELKWVTEWQKTAHRKVICPICRKRPKEDDIDKVCCRKCMKIRREEKATGEKADSLETSFHSEISQGNSGDQNRLALLVARFDLRNWLDGSMLYSQFVKETRCFRAAMDHLGNVKKYEDSDQHRKTIFQNLSIKHEELPFSDQDIKELIELCEKPPDKKKELAEAFAFLFDRHQKELKLPDWKKIHEIIADLKNMGKKITLQQYLMTKNHSPSRLLRIWNGTRDFFRQQNEIFQQRCLDEKGRLVLQIKKMSDETPEKSILAGDAELADSMIVRNVEVVREGSVLYILAPHIDDPGKWSNATFQLTSDEFTKKDKNYSITVGRGDLKPLVRARTITVSPDIFMMAVPADKALGLARAMTEDYQRQFGKVYGRLPMSIGILYFDPHLPMFVVLDGARRLLNNFEMLSKNRFSAKVDTNDPPCPDTAQKNIKVNISEPGWEREVTLPLPLSLGTGDVDFFHPYLFIKNGPELSEREGCYETPFGKVIHFGDLKNDDTIEIYPNFFDFEYLDASRRRFDLSIEKPSGKRRSGADQRRTRPMFLEDLDQHISSLWGSLQGNYPDMTDSKLHNIRTLFHEWEKWSCVNEDDKRIVASFVRSASELEMPKEDSGHLFKLVRNGLFFDTLELYLEILKERIDDNKQ